MIVNQLRECIDFLKDCTHIYFDFECTLDPHESKLYILSLHGTHPMFDSQTFVFDLTDLYYRYEIMAALKPIMEDKTKLKVAHNAVFDWKQFYHQGIYVEPVYCTMIAEQVLNSGLLFSGFGLDDVAERRLGITVDKTVRKNFINRPDGLPITEEELLYAANDTMLLEPIYNQQQQDLDKQDLCAIIDLEAQLIPTTAKMEYRGVCIDKEKLKSAHPVIESMIARASVQLQDEIIKGEATAEITFDGNGYTAANLGSPKQMLDVFNALGINVRSLNKKELSDWDAQWARKHAKQIVTVDDGDDYTIGFTHPVLRLHATRTALDKLQGTYIEGLLDRINPRTSRVHPGFKQCGAVSTGRFSSVSPNFQNLPNKDKLRNFGLDNYDIRSMFIPAAGRDFIICDYSGIELSILAALSGDEQLIHQILAGDIHSFVANNLAGEKIKSAVGSLITKENKGTGNFKIIRDLFKPVSYGIIYGSTGYNLYRTLYFALQNVGVHINQTDADLWVERWKHELFPNTGKTLGTNSELAVTQRFTSSAMGRKRFWPADVRSDKWKMLAAMREGSNQPIQGACADMIKLAMYLVDKELDERHGRLVACIHDELLTESAHAYTETASEIVQRNMEKAARDMFPYVDPQLFRAEPKVSNCYDK